MFSQVKYAALSLAVLAAMAQPASAATIIDFNSVASGATANSAAPAGISFVEAEYVTSTDSNGDEILGSEHWQAAVGGSPVLVRDPNTFDGGFYDYYDYGSPSAPRAMDARFAPVMLQISGGIDLTGFSFSPDNSSFGNLPPSSILLLDAAGLTLASFDYDQTATSTVGIGFSFSPIHVSSILLSSGGYYDNIELTAVPLPAAFPLLVSALSAFGFVARRKRS